jgi:hypothetical protein
MKKDIDYASFSINKDRKTIKKIYYKPKNIIVNTDNVLRRFRSANISIKKYKHSR